MTLLPPKDEASALPEEPVSDGAEGEAPAEILGEPVREEPDEALIRAFEAEMTKAGAVVHEYGVETAPGMADASGVPDETEAPALSTEAVDQEFAEMHPEAQESSVPEPAERTYAEDLELLFGDAPVADAPQVEPSPVAPEPAMEAPMLVSPEGRRARKLTPALLNRLRPRRKGLLRNLQNRCPLPHRRMRLPSRCRNLPRTARIGRLRPCRGCAGRSRQRRRAASGAFLRP